MRIIGGKHRSKKLIYHKSKDTRPTSDAVREAVFNMLFNVNDYLVLDLFAGVGSYGLESLSRGAKLVYFNDIKRQNIFLVKDNLKSLKEESNAVILNLDYQKAINNLASENIKFDLIFIDPPYYQNYYETILKELPKISNENTKVVIEIDKHLDINNYLDQDKIINNKVYGNKRILITYI